MIDRMEKINELIKRELSQDLFRRFAGEFISVNEVSVSRDLSYAKVWINSLFDTTVAENCQDQAVDITRSLARKLPLKKVPKLHFFIDTARGRAEKIEELIGKIHKKE